MNNIPQHYLQPFFSNSLITTLSLAKDCVSELARPFVDEYCCDDPNLGCFNQEPPNDIYELPCCYDDTDVTYSLYTRDNKKDAKLIRRASSVP